MKPNRREFLGLLGLGAGALVAGPAIANIPDLIATTAPEPLDTLGELAYQLNGQYVVATQEQACAGIETNRVVTPRDIKHALATAKQNDFDERFFHTVVTYP
jgi:hypothetical protein